MRSIPTRTKFLEAMASSSPIFVAASRSLTQGIVAEQTTMAASEEKVSQPRKLDSFGIPTPADFLFA